jgi:hypothetical protein
VDGRHFEVNAEVESNDKASSGGQTRAAFVAMLALVAAASASLTGSLKAETPEATHLGREALRAGRFVWYDESRDEARISLPRERRTTGPTETRSEEEPSSAEGGGNILSGSDSGGGILDVFMYALIALGAGALAAAVWTAWKRPWGSSPVSGDTAAALEPKDSAPMGPIAWDPRREDAWDAAQRARDAGRLAEAMMLLFNHQLRFLDRAGLLSLERGKTNRECLEELPYEAELRGVLGSSIALFEDAYFGGREVFRGALDEVWSRWEAVQRKVEARSGTESRHRGGALKSIASRSALVLLAALLAGCAEGWDEDEAYGDPLGSGLNGTSVLGRMFTADGHEVEAGRRLSAGLESDADVVVCFERGFAAPSYRVVSWAEDWLEAAPGRCFVYVVRDYDARIAFLEEVIVYADHSDLAEARELHRELREDAAQRRQRSRHLACQWFHYSRDDELRSGRTLSGDQDWVAGVDPTRARVTLGGRFGPAEPFRRLLAADGEDVVAELKHGEGRVILVVGGSFLLNYALINREHRVLALALSRELGRNQRVVFAHAVGAGDPSGDEAAGEHPSGDAAEIPDGLRLLGVWPYSFALWHLLALGALYCLHRFPILGRPRTPRASLPGFGGHVEAVGRLLAETRDPALARALVEEYRSEARRRQRGEA